MNCLLVFIHRYGVLEVEGHLTFLGRAEMRHSLGVLS